MHFNLLNVQNRCWRSLFWESKTSSLLVAELHASVNPDSQGPVQVASIQSFVQVASFLQGSPFPTNTLSPNIAMKVRRLDGSFSSPSMLTYIRTHTQERYMQRRGTGFVSGEPWAENPGFPFVVNATMCETFSLAKLEYFDPK